MKLVTISAEWGPWRTKGHGVHEHSRHLRTQVGWWLGGEVVESSVGYFSIRELVDRYVCTQLMDYEEGLAFDLPERKRKGNHRSLLGGGGANIPGVPPRFDPGMSQPRFG